MRRRRRRRRRVTCYCLILVPCPAVIDFGECLWHALLYL